MEAEFWLSRWRDGQLGWHLPATNPHLLRHWATVAPDSTQRVLVPLCGRSVDLAWLAGRGHAVRGVELSPIAAREFFVLAGLEAEVTQRGQYTCYAGQGIEILQGDFLALQPADCPGLGAWYDRGSLVALPPELRERYVTTLARVLPSGARGLLVATEYEAGAMQAPPFPLDAATVRAALEGHFRLELLERVDALADNPRFMERGLTAYHESCWLLERR
ncbi:MAG: thiopurine S-methyltransferase [Steroidobacteraceae bacterium]